MHKQSIAVLVVLISSISSTLCNAALITFDDVIVGQTSYAYDGDGDGVDDAVFSTSDPLGFNTVGPGPNQLYIDEPGIEGTTLLNPDLRVDFAFGAIGTLGFGFAMLSSTDNDSGVTFNIYDAANSILSSTTLNAAFTAGPSAFPEALLSSAFTGTASYATFDFIGVAPRYIIDNFTGTFGSDEEIEPPPPPPQGSVPIPGSFGLTLLGLSLLGMAKKKMVTEKT